MNKFIVLLKRNWTRILVAFCGSALCDVSGFNRFRLYVYAKLYNMGNDCRLGHHVDIFTNHSINNTLSIGNHVLISNNCEIDISGDLIIEDFVSISNNVTILTHNHDVSNFVSENDVEKYPVEKSHLRMGKGCWVGSQSVILPSCHSIGRGAIVGAGSVVRDNVPPYSVVIGNPARVVSFRFSVEEILEYENRCFMEHDRLDKSTLEKNYYKYFEKRLDKIKESIRY